MEQDLNAISRQIREETVRSIGSIGIGHIGGCLSLAEILAVLYFKHMNIKPENPQLAGRDRLVVSKGHAGPALYAALALRGYFPKEELLTLNTSGTNLPSHCDMHKTPGIDMTTGSLGQGFSCAVGIALASRLRGDNATIFAIIGDGESQEGQIWEAAMYAGNQKLNRLIAFTDYNDLQIDGNVSQVNDVAPLEDKWRAFKWHTLVVDGHDVQALDSAIQSAKGQDKPTMIIARTIKGKGVSFVVSKGAGNHNMPFSKEDAQTALEELRRDL
jgi:transketolase